MERKSIGGFIAALRKANGYTQKELAEKLNVSDKAVSRWERDECAPDLSLIPIIAEIFDVTTDELLSGERRANTAVDNSSKSMPRAEKQLQKMLDSVMAKFHNLSLIPIILSVLTVFSAVIIPHRYISLAVGSMLVLISVICEIIFLYNAHTSTYDDDLPTDKLENFRQKAVDFSKIPFAVSFYSLYFLFALQGFLTFCTGYCSEINDQLRELLTNQTHNIFSIDVLFIILLYALFAYILFKTIWTVVLAILVKRNIYPSDEQKTQVIKKKRLFFAMISIIISLTLLGEINYYGNGWMNGQHFVEGEIFYDADSFKKYVAKNTEPEEVYAAGLSLSYITSPDTIVNAEESSTADEVIERFACKDGSESFDFVVRNNNICQYYSDSEDSVFPIVVYTYFLSAKNELIFRNICVSILTIELIASAITYYLIFKRKKKHSKQN